jgi:hypothetical protein
METPATNTDGQADVIMSIAKWSSNADLIVDCARLKYLRPEWRTLDPTYGLGTLLEAVAA